MGGRLSNLKKMRLEGIKPKFLWLIVALIQVHASAQTWTKTTASSNYWSSIACSADGSKLVAATSGAGAHSMYTSTNAGLTWTSNNFVGLSWNGVASSADGKKLAAVSANGAAYTSTNSGLT